MGNSLYPNNIDFYTEKQDTIDTIYAAHINDPQQAIINIETELGLNPKGGALSVANRLDTSIGNTGAIVQKLVNKSGSTVPQYRVVISDPVNDASSTSAYFSLTTVRGDHRIVGITEEGDAISVDAPGRIVAIGKSKVYVNASVAGPIYKGDLLVASAKSGFAEKLIDNVGEYPSEGILGIALQDYTGTGWSGSDTEAIYCYVLCNQSLNFGSYSRETRKITYVSPYVFKIIGTDVASEYFVNKKLMLLSSSSLVETTVQSVTTDATHTFVTCVDIVPASLLRVFYQAVNPDNVGIIDLSNESNMTLKDHVGDGSIHRQKAPYFVIEDLSSQVSPGNLTFVTSQPFALDGIEVFVGGLLMQPIVEYTLPDTSTIVFPSSGEPSAGVSVVVSYVKATRYHTIKFNEDLSSQVTGSNSIFYTSQNYIVDSFLPYRNGVAQVLGDDFITVGYTSSGYAFQFITNSNQTCPLVPTIGSKILVRYERSGNLQSDSFTFRHIGDATIMNATDGCITGKSGRVSKVLMKVTIAPTGASLKVDIKKNGISIFTAGYMELPAGSYSVIVFAGGLTGVDFTDSDLITMDILQVGSIVPGGDDIYVSVVTEVN